MKKSLGMKKKNNKRPLASKKLKGSQAPISTIPTTDVQAAMEWVVKIDERSFRDQVLRDVFRGMKQAGLLAEFKNVHGINENGIDYLLVETHPIHGEMWTGIQVKSKEIRPSTAGDSVAAIDVVTQCERAAIHTFQIDGKTSRLDLIEIWCSRLVTDIAEKEILTSNTRVKLGLKGPHKIIDLIRDYAPEWLSKIPECALARYVNEGGNPIADGFRLLKTKINVRDHFIEPLFSEQSMLSSETVADSKLEPKSKRDHLRLNQALEKQGHLLIYGANLSGKTYLLKRIRFLVSQRRQLCVYCDSEYINSSSFGSAAALVAELCPPLRGVDVEALSHNAQVVVCVDDIHSVDIVKRNLLLATSSKEIRVVGTLERINNLPGDDLSHIHIAGVDLLSVTEVVRTLEKLGDFKRPLVDRAQAFIQRTFSFSGMPLTPFSVAMALEFLDSTPTKLNTPTFGRLINRFIENQLGSHDDASSLVDFESKRAFLRKLSGRSKDSYDIAEMRREVISFLAQKGHKHKADDFLDDLVRSGVFKRGYSGRRIGWAHSVMRLNFWVSSVLDKGVHKPLEKKLLESPDVTLAALVGSRLENAGELVKTLLKVLPEAVRQTKNDAMSSLHEIMGEDYFPSDEKESEWLKKIEDGNFEDKEADRTEKKDQSKDQRELTRGQKNQVKKKIEPYMATLLSGNFHVVFNLCGLILNARDTNASVKENAVERLIEAFDELGDITSEVFAIMVPEDSKFRFISYVISRFFMFGMLDHFLGDPFLGEIFKRVLNRTKQPMRRLLLLDLLLGCGDEVYDEVVLTLKNIKRLDVSWMFYLRIMFLYQSRFHRSDDRKQLRNVLERIRKIHRNSLPALPPSDGAHKAKR